MRLVLPHGQISAVDNTAELDFVGGSGYGIEAEALTAVKDLTGVKGSDPLDSETRLAEGSRKGDGADRQGRYARSAAPPFGGKFTKKTCTSFIITL